MSHYAELPEQFQLGQIENKRVPLSEQKRQRAETEEILRRMGEQPGVVLADEVGMGKTYVALAVSYCVGVQNRKGPVVIMVPPNLIEKWVQDLDAFCSHYLNGVRPISRSSSYTACPRYRWRRGWRPSRSPKQLWARSSSPPGCRTFFGHASWPRKPPWSP